MRKWQTLANDLVETLADSIAGYDVVGSHTRQFDFYAYCEQHVAERREQVQQFRIALNANGFDHDPHGTLLGVGHRLFIELRSALHSDERALVEELVRGETYLAEKISGLRRQKAVPQDVREYATRLGQNVGRAIFELKSSLHDAPRKSGAPAR